MSSTGFSTNFTQARNYAFYLLKFTNRSQQEIRERLTKKKYSQSIIAQTIQYLEDIHCIDDRQFAREWIKARLHKPFGLKRISFELHQKGIDNTIIREELSNAKANFPEEEIAIALSKKIASKYKGLKRDRLKPRVFGYLSRRGFSSEVIEKAIGQL